LVFGGLAITAAVTYAGFIALLMIAFSLAPGARTAV